MIFMNLRQVLEGREYTIKNVDTGDAEMNAFLFSLGCYSGESITVVKRLGSTSIVAIKDGRYSIDNPLAESICV